LLGFYPKNYHFLAKNKTGKALEDTNIVNFAIEAD
jgi:hypothetical protein